MGKKKNKTRPVDERGIYKDGAQQLQEDKNEMIFPDGGPKNSKPSTRIL